MLCTVSGHHLCLATILPRGGPSPSFATGLPRGCARLARVRDRSERQFFSGTDVNSIIGAVGNGLSAFDIQFVQTGSNSWLGKGSTPSYGMLQKVSLVVYPSPQGFYLDVRYGYDFDSTGAVLFVLAWFLFFPAAIVLAILAYNDFTARQDQLMQSIWNPVRNLIIAPNFAPAFGQQPR